MLTRRILCHAGRSDDDKTVTCCTLIDVSHRPNAPVASVAPHPCLARIEATMQVSDKTNCEHSVRQSRFGKIIQNHPTPWIIILRLGSLLVTKMPLGLCSEFRPIRYIPRPVTGTFREVPFHCISMKWGKEFFGEVFTFDLSVCFCNK